MMPPRPLLANSADTESTRLRAEPGGEHRRGVHVERQAAAGDDVVLGVVDPPRRPQPDRDGDERGRGRPRRSACARHHSRRFHTCQRSLPASTGTDCSAGTALVLDQREARDRAARATRAPRCRRAGRARYRRRRRSRRAVRPARTSVGDARAPARPARAAAARRGTCARRRASNGAALEREEIGLA